MKCLLQNDPKCSKKKKNTNRFCISHRQGTILCAILIFIFSAIFTACAALGYFHSWQTLDILTSDIQLEQEKHLGDGEEHPSTNEVILTKSQKKIMSNKFMLDTLMHYGLSLIMTSGLLLYGLLTRRPYYMVPWIFWSAWSYLAVLLGEVLMFFGYIEGLSFIHVRSFVVPNLIFFVFYCAMWYVIYRYFTIAKTRCSTVPRPKPKKVHTQEGLIHTVNPSKKADPKIYQV